MSKIIAILASELGQRWPILDSSHTPNTHANAITARTKVRVVSAAQFMASIRHAAQYAAVANAAVLAVAAITAPNCRSFTISICIFAFPPPLCFFFKPSYFFCFHFNSSNKCCRIVIRLRRFITRTNC